jgi:hypothetical protein
MFNLHLVYTILPGLLNGFSDSWVLAATVWRVLRLWIEERPTIWRAAANILTNSRGKPTRGGPLAWILSEVLTTPYSNNLTSYETFQKACHLD